MPDRFTPLDATRTRRLAFDEKDVTILDGDIHEPVSGPVAVVEIEGKRHVVIRMACDPWNNCICDAYIQELAPSRQAPELVASLF